MKHVVNHLGTGVRVTGIHHPTRAVGVIEPGCAYAGHHVALGGHIEVSTDNPRLTRGVNAAKLLQQLTDLPIASLLVTRFVRGIPLQMRVDDTKGASPICE